MFYFALSATTGPRLLRAWQSARQRLLFGGCLLFGLLGGCALVQGPGSPDTGPPTGFPRPSVPQGAVEPPARVAILYAGNVDVYQRLAARLKKNIGPRAQMFSLAEPTGTAQQRYPSLSAYRTLIAIGPLAARRAAAVADKRLVFCQVFNYQDYSLAKPNTLGVEMLAPPQQQFRAWHRLAPDIKKVGVLTGPGHERLIRRARSAANQEGIQLVHRVALTDKDMLYEFKRLVPEIDGLWLLPDERILSHRVLRELMRYSARHGKQVAAFAPQLLRLGALLSASSVESDIADQVVAALRNSETQSQPQPFQLLPLTRAEINVNSALAHRLGYKTLTDKQRETAHAP